MKPVPRNSILLTLSCAALAAQTDWQVSRTFQLGGSRAWDYLTADPATHRLYVPRTTHTTVIDEATGTVIADIPGQKNAHGEPIEASVGC